MRGKCVESVQVCLILLLIVCLRPSVWGAAFQMSGWVVAAEYRPLTGAGSGEESSEDDSALLFEDETSWSGLDSVLGDRTDVGFSDLYGMIKAGDVEGALALALEACVDSLVYELRSSRAIAVQIIAVIILGSTFAQLSAGNGDYVAENSFLVTYLVLMTLLLGNFAVAQEVVTDTIGDVTEFMKAFYPMYAASIVYVQGPESAKYSQSVIVLVIYVCQNIILGLILPLIRCSCILSIVNSIGREDYFSKLGDLMKSVASWGLKSMFAVITGINVIKCMIAPSMDRLSRNGILRSLGRVSGMASVSAACSVIISTGEFIKSCMGVTCTVILIIISVIPMLKLLVMVFMLKCIAALVQPVGDRRYADGVGAMASGIELMLKACGISVMMFVLSVALMTMSIGG